MTWTIYKDGLAVGHYSGPAAWLPMNTPAGCLAVEGEFPIGSNLEVQG